MTSIQIKQALSAAEQYGEGDSECAQVARLLADEVQRLRSALEDAPTVATAEELEHEHRAHLIEAYGRVQAASEQASSDKLRGVLAEIDGHLRLALNLDPRR